MNIYKITSQKATNLENEFDVQLIPPTMGNELSAEQYFSYVVPEYNTTGKLLTPAELGCVLSHIKIYERIVETNISATIFEADIVLERSELSKAVLYCANTSHDFIHLGWHPNVADGVFFKGEYISNQQIFLVDTTRNFYGAYAYFVSIKFAKELLEYHSATIKLADSWARFFMSSDIHPYFKPFFTHPQEREGLHTQRLKVSNSVYRIDKENMMFFLRKIVRQKLSNIKFWLKDIKPKL